MPIAYEEGILLDHNLSRRRLLRTTGGLAAGVTLGAFLGQSAQAAQTAEPAGAVASLPVTDRYDLSQPSYQLIREKALQNNTVLQSLAIDSINRRIYTVQVMQGGIQLSGESGPVSGTDRAAHGDLCVTQLDLAGNKLGYMYLKGFGHGVQIGVEPVGTAAYLWTETDSVNERGTALARFKFVSGQILTTSSTSLQKHWPVAGSTYNTCTIDPTTNRLIFRHSINGATRYNVYNLDDVKAGNYSPLASVVQPSIIGVDQPFQGYTARGSYLYTLEGSAYGTTGSVYPTGNTYITSVDLNSGSVAQRSLTKAGYTLTYREPEGMGLYLPNPSDPGTAQLCFGFASGDSGARKASIYYKDALIW